MSSLHAQPSKPSDENSQREEANSQKLENGDSALFDRINTLAMSMFTGVMIVIMFYQSCQTQESLKLTKAALKQSEDSGAQAAKDVQESLETTRRGVAASERSARAAEDAVRLSAESLEREQRAWVGIGESNVGGFEPNRKGIFNLSFGNFGKTPAFNVKTNMGIFTRGRGDPPPPRMDLPSGGESGTVFPGFRYGISRETREELPADTIERIRAGDIHFYALAIITYKDAFNKSHTTRFCTRLFIDIHGNKNLRTCGFHDEAD